MLYFITLSFIIICVSETGKNSYSIDFEFRIADVNIPEYSEKRNEIYNTIQQKINSLVSKIYSSGHKINRKCDNYKLFK